MTADRLPKVQRYSPVVSMGGCIANDAGPLMMYADHLSALQSREQLYNEVVKYATAVSETFGTDSRHNSDQAWALRNLNAALSRLADKGEK